MGTETNDLKIENSVKTSLRIREQARLLDDQQVREVYERYGLTYYEGADPNEYKLVCYLEAAEKMLAGT